MREPCKVFVLRLTPLHRGTPHVGPPTEKQSPGLFFLSLLHLGKEKVRFRGAAPDPASLL